MMIAIMRGAAPSATVGQSVGIVLTGGREGGRADDRVVCSEFRQIPNTNQPTNTNY